MLSTKKIIVVFAIIFTLINTGSNAQENLSAEEGEIKTSTELEFQLSTEPGAKAILTQSFIFPVFQGTNPLVSGNNLKTSLIADLTPVSFNGAASLTLTPIAFLELAGGAKAGSGWKINLFGGDIHGVGVNTPIGTRNPGDPPRYSEIIGEALGGVIWSYWAGGALQFDLAAIFPGDWNHVLFRTYHEARYSAYTEAKNGESWIFESDFAENRNGWTYNASYVLAYQMPLSPYMNLVGIMAELKQNLYNVPNKSYWGDDIGYWILSALLNFSITPEFNTTVAVQFHTVRNFGSTDLENKRSIYYQDRKLLSNQGESRAVLYRLALLMNYKIR